MADPLGEGSLGVSGEVMSAGVGEVVMGDTAT